MSDRDQLECMQLNGDVVSSSQLRFLTDTAYRRVFSPMEAIILSVQPSDSPDNLSSGVVSDSRGFRHECSVLVVDNNGEPSLILENVVIPPQSHSGINDFEEDLPRGVVEHVDKMELSENWKNLDWSRLDGEHCIVAFIGGSIDKPYIQNWWPHPANKHDPATTGAACLQQVDVKKYKTRAMRRVNGVLWLVTGTGDCYLNTSEANSSIEVSPKPKRTQYEKGGNVQVDIKSSQQLEVNWNTFVEGLKAGSSTSEQAREPSLPHLDHDKALAATVPPARGTKKTFLRYKQYEMLQKTSNFTIWCENTEDDSGKKGEATLLASDAINLYVREGTTANDPPCTTISITEGTIQLLNNDDGTQVSVLNDEVQIVTKSGGFVSIKGNVVTVNGNAVFSGPVAIGGAAAQPLIKGTAFLAALNVFLGKVSLDPAATVTAAAAAELVIALAAAPPITGNLQSS